MSHELRTPLTAVRGFAESLVDGVVEGDDAREAAGVILAESQRLDRLVQDLLDLARLGADDFRLEPTNLDLTELLDQAARVWTTRAAARSVRVDVESEPVPLLVVSDATRLRQVVDGLAENALRMTPAGGVVVLALARHDGGARLQVRDSGPGIPAQDRAVAFEPGALGTRYRDQRPVGVGIGLSLLHALVVRLGGTLEVGDAPEGGASFTATLPAIAPR